MFRDETQPSRIDRILKMIVLGMRSLGPECCQLGPRFLKMLILVGSNELLHCLPPAMAVVFLVPVPILATPEHHRVVADRCQRIH